MSAAFETPARLEKYELLEELGHGGMATVYRALDRRLGREVAVKLIHRHLRDEREVKERFYREAKAVAKLRHPGIVEVYDVSEPDEPERYLVVELVRGITLRQLLRDHGPLPTELGLGIAHGVAEALFHAHSQGVVHRDVKPENVLLELPSRLRAASNSEIPSAVGSQPGVFAPRPVVVKITDFGIAKILDAQGVTSTGEVLGSPAHMAPEQIEGQAVGPKADLFSLGVLLYETIVGNLPFQGNNPAQVLRRVLEGQFVATERARPAVGALVGRVVDRALAHDPEKRYADASEFAQAIAAELTRVDVTEPLRLLDELMEEPKDFAKKYEQRMVATLLDRAQRARREGAVMLAAAHYNRALALRPGDAAIVSDLARITRLQRYKTRVLRGALAAVAIAAVGASAMAVHKQLSRDRGRSPGRTNAARERVSEREQVSEREHQNHKAAPLPSVAGASMDPAASSSAATAADSSSGKSELNASRLGPSTPSALTQSRATAPRSSTALTAGKRLVQVVLSGAAGSRLLIDGAERPWFGVKHELEIGVHQFQAVAPNEQCCVVPEPRSVKIGPGDGEIRVVLAVEFRDAQLQLVGAEGTTLTCGELFPGILAAPGRRSVRVSKPETQGSCTVFPPPESGKRPRTIDVVLRPGGTFTVTGT